MKIISKKIIMLIVCLCAVFVLFTACGEDKEVEEPKPTATPEVTATPKPTAPPVATPVPTATPEPTPPREPLTAEQLNKPFAEDVDPNCIEIIFSDDYESDDWSNGGEAISQQPYVETIDGQLHLPSSGGEHANNWVGYAPNHQLDLDYYQQIEISFDLQTKASSAVGLSFGFFVSGLGSKIPNGPGDGLWVSLCAGKNVAFLGLTSVEGGGWPNAGGFAQTTISEGFSTMKKVYFILTEDKVTGYAINTDGTQECLFSAEKTDSEIILYDGTGTEFFRGEDDPTSKSGSGFKIFAHYEHTIIDNMLIRGYSY